MRWRWLVPALVVVGVFGGMLTGCEDDDQGIGFENRTGETIDYVYLAPDPGGAARSIITLEAGGSETLVPLPQERGCSVAPIVARGEGGREIARLDPTVCWDPSFRWVLTEEDAGR